MLLGVKKLLPAFKNLIHLDLRPINQVLKVPAKRNYQVNSQLGSKKRVFHSKGRPLSRGISRLAAVLLLLGFFLNYQPNIQTFPPFRQNIAQAAEPEQTLTITADSAEIGFSLPHPGYISTYYSTYHPGIDIASGLGMPVHPAAGGTVTSAGFNFWGLGLTIEIDHGKGYKSLYAHLGKIYVKEGQIVDKNDTIGEVGLTGNTSGPHTHFEMLKDGKTFNPEAVLPTLPSITTAWANTSSTTVTAAVATH